MVSKFIKLLSGVFALVRKPRGDDYDNDMVVLKRKYRSGRDTNVRLIRERCGLRKRLQQMESMSDADRGNEHAAELDRVKSVLLDRHGLSISRMQVASAVHDLSDRLAASAAWSM